LLGVFFKKPLNAAEPSCVAEVNWHSSRSIHFAMNDTPFGSEEYAVLHFSLVPTEEGKPMQKTQACGVYRTIEEAFVSARLLAVREWQRLRSLASAGTSNNATSVNWQVIDTEFGYDLKRDSLVVSRFWIHARTISQS
jgi:hypothetical protein